MVAASAFLYDKRDQEELIGQEKSKRLADKLK